MKLVVQVKLLPTPMQAAALEATLRACNAAATWVSKVSFERQEFKNFALRKLTYEQAKSRWRLGAQAAQHTIKKACDAYATLRANVKAGRFGRSGSARHRCVTEQPVAFRPFGAQPFDDRMLQNTPSAKRRLKKRHRKEARRARDINHKIAKHVVAEAERTGRGTVLEKLTGIRERVRLRKPQRATPHSWSFAQLGQFIAYKARRAGVPVVHVDPAYTSRTCAECGHIDRANRVSQARFTCRSCTFVDHADRTGSRDIRARAWELWRRGAVATRGRVNSPCPAPASEGRGWTQTQHHRQWCPVVQARRFSAG
ncbi:RNA-guided endonuclease TnpB family protein [Streptomyces sp. NPDC097107]|uniref:RNA-guided endonuclease TnpB family protein n=1 Tax=Streptomyces sp. NPDC097107 TaxID=3366089 RepID=UPI0038146FFF